MPKVDDNWDRKLARLVVSPGAILSLQKAAELLPIADRDARAWLRRCGLVRNLAGRPVIIWQEVIDALANPPEAPPKVAALRRVEL